MVAKNSSSALPADRVLVITRNFNAPRALVFRAWTKPEHLVRWWGPSGFTLPFCETDFRVGGNYRYCMRAPNGDDHWVWGTFREIVEPERLVFTWERDTPAGTVTPHSVVTLTFDDEGARTKFTLHHAVFVSVADRDDHRGGWTECLARLAEYVEAASK